MDAEGNLYNADQVRAMTEEQKKSLEMLKEEEFHKLQKVNQEDRQSMLREWRKRERQRR